MGIGIFGLVLALRPVNRPATTVGLLLTVALSPSLVYFSRTIGPAIFVAFFSLLFIVAISRAAATRSDTGLLAWAATAGFALASLIATGPIGISAGLSVLIACVVTAFTASVSKDGSPDAIALGGRRLIGTPGAVLFGLGVMLATLLVWFSRLFSDVDGVTGILETFSEWGQIVGTRPSTTPAQFYFWATLLYELVAVVLLIVALWSSASRYRGGSAPRLHPGVFGVWFGVSLVLQSLSSGRSPEQFLLVSLPLVLGAGFGLGLVIEKIEENRLFTTIASLVPVAVLGLVIGVVAIASAVARANAPGASLDTFAFQAEILMILLLVVVPLSYFLGRECTRPGRGSRVAWSAFVVLVLLLGVYGARSASMLAWERSDEGTELLAQQTTTDGVTAFVDQTTRLSRDLTVSDSSLTDPTGRFGISIAISPDVEFPYRWYFRDFPNVNVTPPAGWNDADLVIGLTSDGMQEAGYIVQSRAHVNRVPPSYEGLGIGDVAPYIFNPSRWQDGIRFLLYRDTTAEPPPQQIAIGYSPELSNQLNPSVGPFNLDDSPGRGSALGQFDTPIGVDVTADGEVILVVDSANTRIERFTADGEFIGVWSGQEDPDLAFAAAFGTGPTGLTVDDDDLIYIADTWNHRVVVLDRNGDLVREIGQPGEATDLGDSPDPTLQPGLFFGPRGIAVSGDEIYVTDTGNERVQVFASDGTFLRAFGGTGSEPGQLIEPVGIAVGPDDLVYVADSGNQRLSIFSKDGEAVDQIAIPSWEGQTTRVNYLAFGPDGLLYMTAPDAGVVDVFDPQEGTIIYTITDADNADLERPIGVAVMDDGTLLITDEAQHDVIRLIPELPNGEPAATPEPELPEATPSGG
jgi:sugar lactone lactonase YvrE